MDKFSTFLFCFVLMLSVNSCELLKPDHMIRVVNNSDRDIYCEWSPYYPDTLKMDYHTISGDSFSRVNAHSSTNNIIPGLYDWVSIFKTIPSDTLLIFVLDAPTIDSIGTSLQDWISLYKSMNDKQLYDWLVKKHYVLSLDDLEWLDWTITYP